LQRRYDAHLVPMLGRWRAPGPGLLRVRWSNAYSWATAKTLRYALHVSSHTADE
jgi:hypothetical protein